MASSTKRVASEAEGPRETPRPSFCFLLRLKNNGHRGPESAIDGRASRVSTPGPLPRVYVRHDRIPCVPASGPMGLVDPGSNEKAVMRPTRKLRKHRIGGELFPARCVTS